MCAGSDGCGTDLETAHPFSRAVLVVRNLVQNTRTIEIHLTNAVYFILIYSGNLNVIKKANSSRVATESCKKAAQPETDRENHTRPRRKEICVCAPSSIISLKFNKKNAPARPVYVCVRFFV